MKSPFSKGPTLRFQDGTASYEVTYRYRLPDTATWTVSKIEMTARSETHCRERCIRFVSQKWRADVEVMRVRLVSTEAAIQTGDPVKTVSESEYEALTAKNLAETEEERKDALRQKGLWIP